MKTKPTESKSVMFLKGKRLYLRPLDMSDVDRCTRWVNDPEIRDFITIAFPLSKTQEEEYIRSSSGGDKIKLAIVTYENVHIGNITVDKIDWINRVATTGTMIGEKEYWGKGYGTEAKMLLLDHLFNRLGIRKVHSAAYAFNPRSIKYSLKCGYKIIGRYKDERYHNGSYHDLVLLEVFKDEWQIAHDTWLKSQK
jgi:diamine N-acetyltransferase